jgi:hypothetical protein
LYSKIQADVPAHRGLGIFVLVLAILQVLAFLPLLAIARDLHFFEHRHATRI